MKEYTVYVALRDHCCLFVFFCLALVEELHQSDPRGLQDGAILNSDVRVTTAHRSCTVDQHKGELSH